MDNLSRQTIKGYELRERIGAGGFGAVYRAFQPAVGREVAIKVILPEFANQPEFIRRFEVEAQLVAHLEDPHIVPLYDYWRDPSGAYLIMRLLRGGSVRKSLNGDPWSLEAIAKLLEQIAGALTTAHRNGVIHRDLKPDNILLDDERNAYLSDFGIAKVINPTTISNSLNLLSPAYAAPEQFKGEAVTPTTDVYSFGIILYELLTGSHPFPKISVAELINKTLNEPLPPLQEIRPDLPAAINGVLQIATAKSASERYGNARQLATAFAQALKSSRGGATIHFEELAPLPTTNPYKGILAFQEADVADFFGREKLTDKIISQLAALSDSNRFLAVVGPSGSGKSSVVKAGLLPLLRQGAVPGSDQWYVAEIMPGSHPLDEVDITLTRLTATPGMNLLPLLREDERGLIRVTRKIFPEGSHLLLVIDQFEEVFTLVKDQTETLHFLESLYAAVTDPRSGIRVVITLRADFYDRPLMHPHFSELVSQHTLVVVPLTAEELERAIVRPAERQGVQFEAGLVSKIASDVHDQPGALPLLQYALTELFERRDERRLTHDAYHAIGGLVGALAKRADELYANLTEEGQELVRQLFLRLVTLGEGVEDTRRRTTLSELRSLSTNTVMMDEIISTFANYRLLSLDNDPGTRTPTVEVAHEAILRDWGRLRAWLDNNRDDIKLQRQLMLLADEWHNAQRDASYLIRGLRLETFEKWVVETKLALTSEERAYLQTSLNQHNREQAVEVENQARVKALERRSVRFLRILVVVLLLATIGAFGLTGIAINSASDAQNARSTSDTNLVQANANFSRSESQRLAAEATRLLAQNGNSDIIALLSIRSLQTQYSPQGDAAIVGAASLDYPRVVFTGHSRYVTSVVFSPDGRYVLTGSDDSTARLWDVATGKEIRVFAGHTDGLDRSDAVISPDGRYVLTGSIDKTARLWDIATGETLQTFIGHTAWIAGVAFSPDNHFALTGSADNTAKLWDIQTGKEIRQFTGHTGVVWSVAFSPDGKYVLTGSDDRTARLWDAGNGQEIRQFTGHEGGIQWIAFSPDGHLVITGSADSSTRMWDTATGQEVRQFVGQTEGINAAIFSPDMKYVLTAAGDGTIWLWDFATGAVLRHVTVHTGSVLSAAFSPDGQSFITGGYDTTARLWSLQITPELPIFAGHTGEVWDTAYSPDGKYVLTGDSDQTARLWDSRTGQQLRVFRGHTSGISYVAFSPDSRFIATASLDKTARLWDIQTGQEIQQFVHMDNINGGISFSHDGQYLLTGCNDTLVHLWDVKSGQEVRQFTGHTRWLMGTTFSPDDRYIFSGGNDGIAIMWNTRTGELIRRFDVGNPVWAVAYSTDNIHVLTGDSTGEVQLWDVRTGQQIRQFVGHSDGIWGVAFSPDGHFILSGSMDKTARLWDIQTGKELRRFVGHTSGLESVAFSPDGRYILTGSPDKTARLWDVDYHTTVDYLCNRLSRDFSTDERQQYDISDTAPTCSKFAASDISSSSALFYKSRLTHSILLG